MLLTSFFAGALLASSALQSTGDLTVALESQLAIEERLLTADQESLREVSEKLRQERRGLEEAEVAFDAAVRTASPDLAELDRLESTRAVARAAVGVLEERAAHLRRGLQERLRRRLELRTAVANSRRGDPRDPLSGDWTFSYVTPPISGTMSLRLDGVLLSGTYALADGRSGSLRGTFVNGRIRLERVDSKLGFDGTLEGTLDSTLGELKGAWTPNELASGGPGVSSWSARRAPLARGARQP